MGNFYLAIGVLLILSLPVSIHAQPVVVTPKLLQQLQETIQQQQEQLRKQARQLQAQSEMLKSLQTQINELKQPPALPPTVAAAVPKTAPPATITSGNDKIELSISGQVNRAVNINNDGYSTNVYHVDNDASNSRVRLVGKAKMSDDLALGTRIEIAVAPDESSFVSQSNQAPGDYFNERWVELSLTSGKYGKISVGKGDTASNNTAEVDLSKTDVVQYASIADISGGMLFREKSSAGALTTIKVSDAFKDLDGLSRQSRLRYDTPRFFGFGLAGSIVSGQRSDLALFWGTEGYGFKAAAAAAVANPILDNIGLQYDGSFSALHTKSGLNLTVSGGLQGRDAGKDASNFYTKLGWLADFTKIGTTAFGVDYTLSQNLPSSEDKGYSIGAAVVQSFDRFATEMYLQYRLYSLDRKSGPPVGDMNVGTVGARVKF